MEAIHDYHSLLSYIAGVGKTGKPINRDVLRPEKMNFAANINAAAAIANPAAPLQVIKPYWFLITHIGGYWQDPLVQPRDIAKVTYVIADPAEGRTWFQNAQNMQRLVGNDTGRGELSLIVPYIMPPSATIQVTFALNIASGAWGGAFKELGISLDGWLVHEDLAHTCGLRAS